jgi:hypothetical protein
MTWVTLLMAVPLLIGAFVGAPVLARELETGTFRYAWTLGVGRPRWTLAKLVVDQGGHGDQPLNYLQHHGYTQWISYQPGSWFWPFQWIEGGWLLALSVRLIAATIWLVRRRAT